MIGVETHSPSSSSSNSLKHRQANDGDEEESFKKADITRGLLMLQDNSTQIWRWRYCCIKDGCFASFTDENKINQFLSEDVSEKTLKEADMHFFLHGVQVEMKQGCIHEDSFDSQHQQHQFTVHVEESGKPSTSHIFAGHSEEDCELWAETIRLHTQQLQSPSEKEYNMMDEKEASTDAEDLQSLLGGIAPDCSDVYAWTTECLGLELMEPVFSQIRENEDQIEELSQGLDDMNDSLYVPNPNCCSSQYQAEFLESGVSFALVRIDDGQFMDCNLAFEEQTGFERDELLKLKMFQVTVPADLPKLFSCLQAMTEGRYCVCKTVKHWQQRNGQTFRVCSMVAIVCDGEQPKYVACFGPPPACEKAKDMKMEDV